jgi:hypothetical protein
MTEPTKPLELEQALTGILGLLVAEREERLGRGEPPPTDLLLADAGLDYGAISRLTGRGYEAVKATVRRGREARTSKKQRQASPRPRKEAA